MERDAARLGWAGCIACRKLDPDRETARNGIAIGRSKVADRLEPRQPSAADQAVRRY